MYVGRVKLSTPNANLVVHKLLSPASGMALMADYHIGPLKYLYRNRIYFHEKLSRHSEDEPDEPHDSFQLPLPPYC